MKLSASNYKMANRLSAISGYTEKLIFTRLDKLCNCIIPEAEKLATQLNSSQTTSAQVYTQIIEFIKTQCQSISYLRAK